MREQLSKTEIEQYLAAGLELAKLCREVILSTVSSGFEVSRKADRSVVTEADLQAEKAFRARVEELFPNHGILGEEFGATRPDAKFQWIVDPVDGTEEFAAGLPLYGTIIGLHYNGQPLIGVIDHPAFNTTYSAGHRLGCYKNGKRLDPNQVMKDLPPDVSPRVGLSPRRNFKRYQDNGAVFDQLVREFDNHRIYHSCYDHTAVVNGSLDAKVEWGLRIWDLAAIQVLVEEAGGKYTVVKQEERPGGGVAYSVVFGKRALVDQILPICRS